VIGFTGLVVCAITGANKAVLTAVLAITGAGFCARAASGQAAAALPSSLMNSRRLMGFPVPRITPGIVRYTTL